MKIIVFGAHPADPIWWTAGTLAKHSRRGDEVTMVSLTCGEHSHANYFWEKELKGEEIPSLEEIKKFKMKEQKDATEVLGVEGIILDYGDSPLKIGDERLKELIDLIRKNKPDVVLTSWHTDPDNIDHATTGKVIWQACHHARELGLKTKYPPHKVKYIYYYPGLGGGLGYGSEVGFVPDMYIDISDTINIKIDAISKFWTQKITKESAEKEVRETAGAFAERVNASYVETFKRLWSLPFAYIPF